MKNLTFLLFISILSVQVSAQTYNVSVCGNIENAIPPDSLGGTLMDDSTGFSFPSTAHVDSLGNYCFNYTIPDSMGSGWYIWYSLNMICSPSNVWVGDTIPLTITSDTVFTQDFTCPCSLTGSTSSTNESTAGANDGTATINASGGTSPYTYLWNDPSAQTTATASGLAGGVAYNVTVTDVTGCIHMASASLGIGPPCTLTVTSSSTAASFPGATDGTATVIASGGTPPYFYLWNDSLAQTTSTATGLTGGSQYNVMVTDSGGCADSASVYVDSISYCPGTVVIEVYPDSALPDVYSFFANVSSGQMPYTYLWSSGDTGAWVNSVTFGSYSVTVTDANGCQTADGPVNPFACGVFFHAYEDSNVVGTSVFTSFPSGKAPFSYSWNFSDGGTSTEAHPVYAFTQGSGWAWATVTIVDANGCISSYTDFVYLTPDTSSCEAFYTADFQDSSGSPGEVFFYGGSNSPNTIVSWLWDLGDGSTSTLQNPSNTYMQPGNYAICLTTVDANGCTDSYCQSYYIEPAWWVNPPNPPGPNNCDAHFIAVQDSSTLGFIYLVDLSFGNHLYYTWDFGNGTIVNSQFPYVSFTSYGMFNICLIITDTITGCTDFHCDTINVDSTGFLIGKTSSGVWGLAVLPTPQPASTVNAIQETLVTSAQVSIYPNPVLKNLNIEITLDKGEQVSLEIQDITGKTIKSVKMTLHQGLNNYRVGIQDLVDGVYFVQITSNQINHFEKVIKVH